MITISIRNESHLFGFVTALCFHQNNKKKIQNFSSSNFHQLLLVIVVYIYCFCVYSMYSSVYWATKINERRKRARNTMWAFLICVSTRSAYVRFVCIHSLIVSELWKWMKVKELKIKMNLFWSIHSAYVFTIIKLLHHDWASSVFFVLFETTTFEIQTCFGLTK